MAGPGKAETSTRTRRLNGTRALPMLRGGTACVVALRALGEDTRVRIVGLLTRGPLDVGEIAARLDVSQYNVSKHLRILREANLLQVEKDGRVHRYALQDRIGRQTANGGVVDLGCCRFEFSLPATAGLKRARRRRAATA